MKTRKESALFLSVGLLMYLLAAPLQAAVVFDDSFADGDRAKTGALDTNWWTSSSSSGDEISVGSLGLVTGGSGRGLHTVFPTQTLTNVDDAIKVSYTFATPATIGTNKSTSLRFGLFDDLGRAGLDADVNASSGSPNALYGWGAATGGPSNQPLPGYMFDHDVNTGASADLNFRSMNQDNLFGTGRLMATTTGFSNVSPSGPDEGYEFVADTEYSGTLAIRRLNATEVSLTGTLVTPTGTVAYSNRDEFDSVEFGLFGIHVNSNTFGSSSSAGEPDNGIDFSNIKVETIVPEPSSIALLLGAMTLLPGMLRRR